MKRRYLVPIVCLLCVPLADAQESRFRYSVQRGDTCYGLARRFLGDAQRCQEIVDANPGLPPRRIVHPGAEIWIPGNPEERASPDATVTEAIQRVEKQAPDVTEWRPASRGDGVYRGWRVHTGERSAAELMFRDRSRLTMRSDTLVVIYGESRGATRRRSTLRVERGNLRSAVEQLRTRIETPGAEVTLASGVAITAVDSEGTARLSNLEGGAATLRSDAGGRVSVNEGFGSAARRGQRPTPPRPLPPAPEWTDDTSRHIGVRGLGTTVQLTWNPVEVARSYRLEVFTEEGALVASTESQRDVRLAELHGFPTGRFVARVSTIDRDFFEGRPSSDHRFDVTVARLLDSDGESLVNEHDAPDPTATPQTPSVVAGSTFVAPDGETCRFENAEPAEELRFSRIGSAVVYCNDARPLTISVSAPRIEAGQPVAHPDGTATVEFRSLDGVMPENVEISAPGATVRSQQDGAALRALIHRDDQMARQVTVSLVGDSDETTLASAVVLFPGPPRPEPQVIPPALAGFGPMDSIVTPGYLGIASSGQGLHGELTVNYLGRPGRDEDSGRSTAGLTADVRPLHLAARVALNPGEFDSRQVGDTEILRLETGFYLVDRADVEVTTRWDLSLGFQDELVARVLPSMQVLWRPLPTLALATRQGASFVDDGSFEAWASAYGLSLRPAEWIEIGTEVHLTLGQAQLADMFGGEQRDFAAMAAGAFVSVWAGPLNLYGAGRASVEPDQLSLGGPVLMTFGVRFVPDSGR